jgi:hypothetical protein
MSILKPEQYFGPTGQLLVRTMFYELAFDHDLSLLTLKYDDHTLPNGRTLLSLPKVYLEYCVNDPTEYTFAQALFGSWSVWAQLQKTKNLQNILSALREEVTVARKAIAFGTLADQASSNVTAAKYLIEEPWVSGNGTDGRKNRQKVRETADQAFHKSGIEEDVKRLKDSGLIN